MTVVEHRTQIVRWAAWGVRNHRQIHYDEIRPIPHTDHLPLTTDCSGFATLCYQLAGCPDPNGRGFDGKGWTGTLVDHGTEIELSEVMGGDLVIYGPGPGQHVAVIVENHPAPNPFAVSHGDSRGPTLIRVFDDPRSKRYFRYKTTTGQ